MSISKVLLDADRLASFIAKSKTQNIGKHTQKYPDRRRRRLKWGEGTLEYYVSSFLQF